MNIRHPGSIGDDFLTVQDEYLQAETESKGITDISDLTPIDNGFYLWQSDIITLKCGATTPDCWSERQGLNLRPLPPQRRN